MKLTVSRLESPVLLPVLFFTPVLLHFGLLLYFSDRIPWIDDYYWYFDFLRRAEDAGSFPALVRIIVTPYNNHWHILQRLVVLAVTAVTGDVPMQVFSWVGNLLYACLFFLFVSENSGRDLKLSPGKAAFAWLYFQPVSYFNFFECGFFNLPVLIFSFLAVRAFSAAKRSGIWWGILATFSNGNGILVWPVAVLIAFRDRDYKAVLRYGFLLLFFAVSYVLLSKGTSGPGEFSITRFWETGLYFVQLAGSVVSPGISFPWWAATLSGLAILAFFALWGVFFENKDRARWFFLLFILASMGIVALTRREVNGLTALVAQHYQVFPQLLLAGVAWYWIGRKELPRNAGMLLLSGAIALSLSNYAVMLPELDGHFALKKADLLNYQEQGKWRLYSPVQGKEEYRRVNEWTDMAVSRGYYLPPVMEKEYLTADCEISVYEDSSFDVSAVLPWRMLFRTVLAEVRDKSGHFTYFPADPGFSSLSGWLRRKKGRRADIACKGQLLNEPLLPEEVTGCRLLVVR